MIVLPSSTTIVLRAYTDATATTTEPYYFAPYLGATDTTWNTATAARGQLTGTTAKTMISAAGSGNQNLIKSLQILNADSVSHTITVELYDTGGATVLAELWSGTVAAGSLLMHLETGEWKVSETASAGGGSETVDPATCDARLTVSSSDPVAESAGAATVYWLPHKGNQVAVWDGSAWGYLELADAGLSITLSALTASKVYDVWAYDDSGSLALETLVWTDDTTRATAIAQTDGVWHKSGDQTRRYLGSFRLDASKQVVHQASSGVLALWNENHRVPWEAYVTEDADSWTYTTATWRAANNDTGNRIDVMVGRQEDSVAADARNLSTNSIGGVPSSPGIGVDSSSANSAHIFGGTAVNSGALVPGAAYYSARLTAGFRSLYWLEISAAIGTTTFYGDNGGSFYSAGLRYAGRH